MTPQTIPFALPVDVVSASSSASSFSPLWPTPPRCPDLVKNPDGTPQIPLPPGSKMGSARAKFKFAASDPGGAANIAAIYGIFSVAGADLDGSNGPSTTTGVPDQGLCNFAYDAVNDRVYLGDGNGGWLGPSNIGSGSDLQTPGGCIIHAGSSTSWASQGHPQASPAAYVTDVTLDVTLPSPDVTTGFPQNKYHLYTYAQNQNYLFDTCRSSGPNNPCPTWKYSGYWWNVQVVK